MRRRSSAFTLTEVLVVLGIIILIVALLLPALASGTVGARQTKTTSHLRQVGNMMALYADDYRDTVLPSQFNHHGDAFPGHPRCDPNLEEWHARGTWADILWTIHEMGAGTMPTNYQYDSPDEQLYKDMGTIEHNPVRSAQPNSRDVYEGTGPVPYGTGAQEAGLPGYLAANQFFNDDEISNTYNGRWTFSQMKSPDRSMYLVDSFAGEVIEDEPEPFIPGSTSTTPRTSRSRSTSATTGPA